MSYHLYLPTRVIFGIGKLNDLHKQNMPGKKAMIVISNGKSTRENGALARTEEQFHMAGIKTLLFDKVSANPLKETVEEGGRFARDHHCDFVVALGGGSVMDAAKIMAMYAHQPGDLWDYVGGSTGKNKPLVNKTLPIVAITTTAGTGSEVDQWSVITNSKTHEKIGCGGMDSLFPVLAVVDPELMLSVPAKYTAYQGFDALFHSTEGYISACSSLMSDMVQLTAIENIGKYLPRAVDNGNDIEAREHLAFANTMSGYSMVVSSCTSEHSMEHAMSAFHPELPHGAGLIMISKEYYTYFINHHVCDERFVKMAQALGMKKAKDPVDFIAALVDLQKKCNVADLKMSDYGIEIDECITLSKNAHSTMGGLFECDRIPLNEQDCSEIYRKSYR